MSTFGLSFDGFIPMREAADIAKRAEQVGASSFWVAEHLGYRESFATSLVLAHATQSARIFPTSVSPYLRHPMPVAMALASLCEYMPDRFGVALGVGNPMFLRESGLEIEKPIKAIRDYISAVRGLLSGERVNIDGQTFRLNNAQMAFSPEKQPLIYTAPMGPQMLRLSGSVADGLVLSAGLTAAYVAQSIAIAGEGATKEGRDPRSLRTAAYIYFIAGGDRQEQNEKVRHKLAFLFRNANIADNIKSSGLAIDQEAIMAAIADRDHAKAASLVPDEAVEMFSIAGDEAECRRRIGEYEEAGLQEIVLSLVGTAEDKMRSLETFGKR